MQELQTNKRDFGAIRINDSASMTLNDGDIRVAVNNFAFTANNITYAVAGEMIRYWEFFPASDNAENNWGIIPVWGFASVAESKHADFAVGEKLFGYFPPAHQLKLTPSKVSPASFFDASDHRADLPPGYNVYRRTQGEANYDPSFDQERMLLFPLYLTAFCLHDMLQDNQWFGAEQIIIGSASSKTSIGLAYAIEEDDAAPTLVGLTSSRNKETVEKMGIYDSVVTYDDIPTINASTPAAIVDMSANADMLSKLHTHLGDNMKFCSNVGMTHWEDAGAQAGIIQERSKMFFAPGHIQKRMQQWGPEKFDRASTEFVMRTVMKSRKWLTIKQLDGLTGLADVYDDVLHGRVSPETGLIINV